MTLEYDELLSTFAFKFNLRRYIKGAALEGFQYTHPMYGRESPVVLGGEYITTVGRCGLTVSNPS